MIHTLMRNCAINTAVNEDCRLNKHLYVKMTGLFTKSFDRQKTFVFFPNKDQFVLFQTTPAVQIIAFILQKGQNAMQKKRENDIGRGK